ncbi:Uma2 family endonuclease [Planosporangium sp. 12N6]|uniref:Uma2 family endonuclease n=1 Tax=Planosporangium spinosum TaxID=3402278 RepID=UPI003CEDBA11
MIPPPDRYDPPPGGWTTADLDRLSAGGRHPELIDGVLLVGPPPGPRHRSVVALLDARLTARCPRGHRVNREVEIRFNERRCFIPDLTVVIGDPGPDRPPWLVPREALIAIEVVAPTSLLMDRIAKPALYAAGGIPYYWRVEIDGDIEVSTYRLDVVEEVYRQTGEFRDTVDVAVPWPIRIPVSEITP